MIKYLILGAIFYGIYVVFFKQKSIKASHHDRKEQDSETMVECKECSAYVSIKEALIVDGKYFCSKECVDAHHRS